MHTEHPLESGDRRVLRRQLLVVAVISLLAAPAAIAAVYNAVAQARAAETAAMTWSLFGSACCVLVATYCGERTRRIALDLLRGKKVRARKEIRGRDARSEYRGGGGPIYYWLETDDGQWLEVDRGTYSCASGAGLEIDSAPRSGIVVDFRASTASG